MRTQLQASSSGCKVCKFCPGQRQQRVYDFPGAAVHRHCLLNTLTHPPLPALPNPACRLRLHRPHPCAAVLVPPVAQRPERHHQQRRRPGICAGDHAHQAQPRHCCYAAQREGAAGQRPRGEDFVTESPAEGKQQGLHRDLHPSPSHHCSCLEHCSAQMQLFI